MSWPSFRFHGFCKPIFRNQLHLINGDQAFFLSNLVVFSLSRRHELLDRDPVFRLGQRLFDLMLVAQVWAFANDIYTPGAGPKAFAITGIGSSLGAIFGPILPAVSSNDRTMYSMMLL